MSCKIVSITAVEILDSRGNPLVSVVVGLDSGVVPSGASTGENEAVEKRDGEPKRFGGKGALQAIASVETEIARIIVGRDAQAQRAVDDALINLDGSPNKARLGANAILGVSMAVAGAAALAVGKALYAYLAGDAPMRLPVPMMNVLNGGRHADSSLDFQEFMIMPLGAPTYREALRSAAETFHELRAVLAAEGDTTAVGHEGGSAPNLAGNEAACDVIVRGIDRAGYRPGVDIAIALDPPATSVYDEDYNLQRSGQGRKSTAELIEFYQRWVDKYSIVSIEYGLAEDNCDGFRRMTAALGNRIQIVGDDIYVTNTDFIHRGIDEKCSNAALIKLNQIGTVSETIAAVDLCRAAGWRYAISHRSRETEDTFIADFGLWSDQGRRAVS